MLRVVRSVLSQRASGHQEGSQTSILRLPVAEPVPALTECTFMRILTLSRRMKTLSILNQNNAICFADLVSLLRFQIGIAPTHPLSGHSVSLISETTAASNQRQFICRGLSHQNHFNYRPTSNQDEITVCRLFSWPINLVRFIWFYVEMAFAPLRLAQTRMIHLVPLVVCFHS
jgi:hypothetical protein